MSEWCERASEQTDERMAQYSPRLFLPHSADRVVVSVVVEAGGEAGEAFGGEVGGAGAIRFCQKNGKDANAV